MCLNKYIYIYIFLILYNKYIGIIYNITYIAILYIIIILCLLCLLFIIILYFIYTFSITRYLIYIFFSTYFQTFCIGNLYPNYNKWVLSNIPGITLKNKMYLAKI